MSIPIMNIFSESFSNVKEHKLSWLKVGFAPIALYTFGFIFFAVSLLSMGQPIHPHELPIGFWIILSHVIHFIISIIAAYSLYINGYRYGILNEGDSSWWNLPLNMRLVKMIVYTLLIGFISVGFIIGAVGVTTLIHIAFQSIIVTVTLGVLLVMLGIYSMIRIGLTFALIAIDRKDPLKTSWHMLKGNVISLFGLYLLIMLTIGGIGLLGILVLGLIGLILTFITPVLAVLFGILVGLPFIFFLWLLNWAVLAKAVSLVYLSFTRGEV